MATVREVYDFLDQRAPFSTQLDFDNAGFLVGRGDSRITRLMVALDITMPVIEQAMAQKAQLIVSHHPVIWGTIPAVTDETDTGRRLLKLMENNMAAICSHTNLDAAEGGVNSVLAERLGLTRPIPLEQGGVDIAGRPYGIGRVGELAQDIPLSDFLEKVKTALSVEGLRFSDTGRPVRRVAVGGGACGGMLGDVIRHGCDTFVTSELKHDVYLEAQALGVTLIDAGHYSTEALICPVLAQWLGEAFPNVEVLRARETEVFRYG